MYYILGSDEKEYGPIGSDVIRNWFQEKRIDAKTMVRREGESDWKLLSSMSEFSYLFPRGSQQAELPQVNPKELEGAVLSRPVFVDAGDCVRRSYDLFKANFGQIFVATLVILVIVGLSGSIPFGFLLTGILYGGLYWFFLKWIRSGKGELGDVFAGFQRQPGQLVLAGLVMGIVPAIVVFIVGAPFFIPLIAAAIGSAQTGGNPEAIFTGLGWLGCLGIGIGCAVAMALYVMWMFAYPLIIDKGLTFWPAMELSRKTVMKSFGGFLWLNILCGLLILAGFIACIVGVVFVAPVCAGAFAYAYEDIFGTSASSR